MTSSSEPCDKSMTLILKENLSKPEFLGLQNADDYHLLWETQGLVPKHMEPVKSWWEGVSLSPRLKIFELLDSKPQYNLIPLELFSFQLFLHVPERRVLSGRAGLAISKALQEKPGASPLCCCGPSEHGWRKAAGGFGAREMTKVWCKHHTCVRLVTQTGLEADGCPSHSVGRPRSPWSSLGKNIYSV